MGTATLVELLHSESDVILMLSAWLLSHIAIDGIQLLLLQLLITLLLTINHYYHQLWVLIVLLLDKNCEVLLKTGVLQHLVPLLSSENTDVLEKVLFIIFISFF